MKDSAASYARGMVHGTILYSSCVRSANVRICWLRLHNGLGRANTTVALIVFRRRFEPLIRTRLHHRTAEQTIILFYHTELRQNLPLLSQAYIVGRHSSQWESSVSIQPRTETPLQQPQRQKNRGLAASTCRRLLSMACPSYLRKRGRGCSSLHSQPVQQFVFVHENIFDLRSIGKQRRQSALCIFVNTGKI